MSVEAIGIVTEFNPFHSGHSYLIEKLRETTGIEKVVCVMSGNFVQRGMPAVFNKWQRSKAAISSGVNLVIQMPTPTSVGSAQYFCKGAVSLLEAMGARHIGFGSETGRLLPLREAAEFLNENQLLLEQEIKALVREGLSYPAARQKAAQQLGAPADFGLLSGSNDLLAVEYLRHVKNMEPVVIKRTGLGHHQSATEIRKQMMKDDARLALMEERLFVALATKLITASKEELSAFDNSKDGLLIKAQKSLVQAKTWDQLVLACKSKRYTYSRISRQLLQFLLGIDQETMDNQPIYGRVLGADSLGREILKDIKKQEKDKAKERQKEALTNEMASESGEMPILITNMSKALKEHAPLRKYLDLEIRSSQLYALLGDEDPYDNHELVRQAEMM